MTFLTRAVILKRKKPIEILRVRKKMVVTGSLIESKMRNKAKMMKQSGKSYNRVYRGKRELFWRPSQR